MGYGGGCSGLCRNRRIKDYARHALSILRLHEFEGFVTAVPTPGKNRKTYLAGALRAHTVRVVTVEGERKNSLLFRPACHPWVNRIERLWEQLHDTVTRNHRQPTLAGPDERCAPVPARLSAVPGSTAQPGHRRVTGIYDQLFGHHGHADESAAHLECVGSGLAINQAPHGLGEIA